MKKCNFKAINDKNGQLEDFSIVVASTKSLNNAIEELEKNGYTVKRTSVKSVDFFVDSEIMVEINNVLHKYCKECEDDEIKTLVSEAIENAMKAACIFYKESKRNSK